MWYCIERSIVGYFVCWKCLNRLWLYFIVLVVWLIIVVGSCWGLLIRIYWVVCKLRGGRIVILLVWVVLLMIIILNLWESWEKIFCLLLEMVVKMILVLLVKLVLSFFCVFLFLKLFFGLNLFLMIKRCDIFINILFCFFIIVVNCCSLLFCIWLWNVKIFGLIFILFC